MIKNIFLLIILFSLIFKGSKEELVHKDKFEYLGYNNVKLYLRYPFYNDGNISKAKVIARLTSQLADINNYRDTIILEFNTGSYFRNKKIEILEKTSEKSEQLITIGNSFKTDSILLNKQQRYKDTKILAYRQQVDEIDVLNSLKVINFGLKNQFKSVVNVASLKDYYGDSLISFPIYFKSLSIKKMKFLKLENNAEEIKAILNSRTLIDSVKNVNLYFKNNTYILENENVKTEINSINSLIKLPDGILIATDNQTIMYLGNLDNSTTKFDLKHKFIKPLFHSKIRTPKMNKELEVGQYYIAPQFYSKHYYILDTNRNTLTQF